MRKNTVYPFILATTFTLSTCKSDNPSVMGNPDIVNRSSSALNAGLLQWANGTYSAECVSHTSTNWSLKITSDNVTMDHLVLAVVQNNTACVLTLTELVTNENTKTTYKATPSITLGAAYAGSASTFANGGVSVFYGDAMMAPSDFSANFTVTILYSDNPGLTTGTVSEVYPSVTASSDTQNITAPNYSFDLNTGSLTVAVNTAYTVQSVAGTASLVAGSVTGNGYYVDLDTLAASPTFIQLHTAYQSASTTAIADTGNVGIAASAFGLSGVSLSSAVYRTIVIQRLVSGVDSYQTFRIAFSHP